MDERCGRRGAVIGASGWACGGASYGPRADGVGVLALVDEAPLVAVLVAIVIGSLAVAALSIRRHEDIGWLAVGVLR